MRQKLLVPYTFVMMNWAAVVGLYRFLRVRKNIHREVWVMPSSNAAPSRVASEPLSRNGSKAA